MIEIDIPGYRIFQLHHLVLDVNGTLAKDGQLIEGVKELLADIGKRLEIHMITADTHGRQEMVDRELKLTAVRIPAQNQAESKLQYIGRLGEDSVVAVGNGANDALMLERAALGIAVIGPEGTAGKAIQRSEIVAADICSALELLLYPNRLIATLRR